MQEVIFREYDIRGKVGSELIIDQVYDLTCAIAYYFKQHKPDIKKIALGMDGRTHSQEIKDEVVRALLASGLDVEFVGTCPTPVLYFALHTTQVDGGIMVTASHNPKEYNGMKICLGTEVVWGKKIQEIKELYKQKKQSLADVPGAYHDAPLIPAYVAWMAEHFKDLKNMNLSAVVDCGNGAAGTVMPALIDAMSWQQVQLLYPEVDGTYPNHEADPTIAANMQDVKKILQTTNTQVGIGIDGDCDRMAPMTKSGFLVPGDQLLGVFSMQLAASHPGAAVVFDIKSSAGLIELLKQYGLQSSISPSGHSIIKDQMKLHHALLGGELSCHFFFADRYFGYDDALYAMLRLFEILVTTKKTLDELVAQFPQKCSSREYRIKCADSEKQKIVQAVTNSFKNNPNASIITIDGVRATLPYGWGLVRAANTQPALAMRFEANNPANLRKVKEDFFAALKPYFDGAWLQQQLELNA